MAKNDDGEFELVLGNNQLLSVFFLVVLLLALCFIGGYTVGRNGAPTLAATNSIVTPDAPKKSEILVAEEDAKPEPPAVIAPAKRKEEPAPEPPKLTPKVETKAEVKAPEVKTADAAPPPTPQKQLPVSSQPVTGRVYLQLSAIDKDRAEAMVDLIRSKSIPAIAAVIPDRPNLYRVLVGPLADNAIVGTREQLKANGFPADDAIRRVF